MADDENKLNEEELKQNSLKISTKEAAAYSFMDGFGLRYVSPFAIALGASNSQVGLLSSVPSLFGNAGMLFTSKAMDKVSRKKIVFLGVLLQSLMWLSLIAIGVFYFVFGMSSSLSAQLLIVCYTLLILFGAFAGPAWTSWMSDLIGKDKGAYFGKRAALAGFVALAGMLVAGFVLDYFSHLERILWGFIVLFSVALLGRGMSAFFVTKQYEPKFKQEKHYYFSFFSFIKKIPSNNFGRFVIYISLTSLTTSIAGPFFVVYMLKDLNFSYIMYTSAIIIGSLATIIFQPAWGKFADKYGNTKVLKMCGAFVSLIPLFWLPTAVLKEHFAFLVIPLVFAVQIFSGFSWAGFNLSVGNFIYDAVTKQRLAICVAYFNVINAFGVFIGALIGGFIASLDFTFLGFTPLLFVFFISGISRFLVSSFFQSQFKEVRKIEPGKKAELKDVFKGIEIEKIGDFLGMRFFKNKI